MRMRHRCLRFVTFLSVTTMLVTPAVASEERPAPSPAAAAEPFCIYPGNGDAPDVGPLPCDASRPYMIGRRGFGSSRIPSGSEFSNGPLSHTEVGGSGPAPVDSSEPVDGTSASPPAADVNSNRSIDIQAP
jgi:hypothetical protein